MHQLPEDVTPGDESGGYLAFSPNSALTPGTSITAGGLLHPGQLLLASGARWVTAHCWTVTC